jgi:hypothetical protein
MALPVEHLLFYVDVAAFSCDNGDAVVRQVAVVVARALMLGGRGNPHFRWCYRFLDSRMLPQAFNNSFSEAFNSLGSGALS